MVSFQRLMFFCWPIYFKSPWTIFILHFFFDLDILCRFLVVAACKLFTSFTALIVYNYHLISAILWLIRVCFSSDLQYYHCLTVQHCSSLHILHLYAAFIWTWWRCCCFAICSEIQSTPSQIRLRLQLLSFVFSEVIYLFSYYLF